MDKTQKRYQLQEERRLQAVPLFEQSVSFAQIARALGVCRQTVSGWHRLWQAEGAAALKARLPGPKARLPGPKARLPGPKARLSSAQREQLAAARVAGPQAAGLDTPLWTLSHIAALVQSRLGVSYHPGHLWRVLHDLGFTCQKPERRARERNETAIREWKEQAWPEIKRGR